MMEWIGILYLFFLGGIALFAGFAIGRFSDKWGGHLNAPHHWIYGLVLMGVGPVYLDGSVLVATVCAGAGLFISDLRDFLHLRFWGVDEKHEWRFWSME